MEFQFKGGINQNGSEKLHVFLVINGYEQIVYEAVKTGTCLQAGYTYSTNHSLIKVFVSQVVSETVINHSFFFRLTDDPEAPEATIQNIDGRGGFFFKAKGRFLKKSEILPLLADDNQSRFYLKTLSISLLQSMVRLKAANVPAAVEGRRVGRKKRRSEINA
jgi:hypothetical protein